MVDRREIERGLLADFRKLTDLRKVNKSELQKAGDMLVKNMKRDIAKGKSPISKGGRFPAYKDPKKYPGKRKPKRPVNLKLTGKFLKDLFARVRIWRNPEITIGFKTKASRLKEAGHREGTNGQPKRPIIPNDREGFSKPIALAFRKRIIEIIRKTLDR